MDLYVFIMIGLCGGCFTANDTFKWSFTRMNANMLLQIIGAMEILAAYGAMKLLQRLVLARMPQPIVLARKLATAIVARIRLNRPVRIHV